MAGNYSILVGTTGAGRFQSPDGGESWSRIRDPFPGESQIRALASDPQSPNVVYAGSNNGIYRSEDSGSSWVKLDSPIDGLNIWSIAIDPLDSDTVFAGTSPGLVFRTRDGGKSWKDLCQVRRLRPVPGWDPRACPDRLRLLARAQGPRSCWRRPNTSRSYSRLPSRPVRPRRP